MRKYQYTICRESMLSRIPGLFPYVEKNNIGEMTLHKATDNVMGCYGKMVENMVVPVSLIVDGVTIIESGTEYSYRTLIDMYYEYIDSLGSDNEFIAFIDKAIGRRKVTDESWYEESEHDLVPEYIYLATAKNEYAWFVKRKALCVQYNKMVEEGTHSDCLSDYCCKCDEYDRKGGDNMLLLLSEMVSEAETIALEYLAYANSATDGLRIDMSIMLSSSLNDIGIMSLNDITWVAGDTYYEGEIVLYENDSYICTGDTSGKWNEDTEKIEFDTDNFVRIKDYDAYSGNLIDSSDEFGTKFKICSLDNDEKCVDISSEDIVVSGKSDSKLKSLRRYKDYLNASGNYETPSDDEDWLYYYRIGNVSNYRTLNDELGNIQHIGDDMTNGNDLYAYGDIITDITYEQDNNDSYKIIFTYIIGGHLKAEYARSETDVDGNVMYYFSNFEWDDTDKYHGVTFTDTYYVDTDSDIYTSLIETGNFSTYVNTIDDFDINKYPFVTYNSVYTEEKVINNSTTVIATIMSDMSATIKNEVDYQYSSMFKYDYLNGITYQPKTDIDVYITRGNAAAFERHIKLGEIKTLDDLEYYANGGFYTMQNVSG